MKKTLLSLLIPIFLFANSVESKAKTEIIPQNQYPSIMELAFLRFLGSTILEVMDAHDDRQLFTYERIEKISRDIENDSYDVSLRVIGFEGPHNPPFKLIRTTIRIPGEKDSKYSVLSYEHRFISKKELGELTKYID
ncbi:hypothetical protein [Virgibacillus sp. MG-45]|uniref:hypothetical protein n=1 Tax=Virgibacillus sp. MG-45 TaxID=3102791 RepID=UPI002EDA1136